MHESEIKTTLKGDVTVLCILTQAFWKLNVMVSFEENEFIQNV